MLPYTVPSSGSFARLYFRRFQCRWGSPEIADTLNMATGRITLPPMRSPQPEIPVSDATHDDMDTLPRGAASCGRSCQEQAEVTT